MKIIIRQYFWKYDLIYLLLVQILQTCRDASLLCRCIKILTWVAAFEGSVRISEITSSSEALWDKCGGDIKLVFSISRKICDPSPQHTPRQTKHPNELWSSLSKHCAVAACLSAAMQLKLFTSTNSNVRMWLLLILLRYVASAIYHQSEEVRGQGHIESPKTRTDHRPAPFSCYNSSCHLD